MRAAVVAVLAAVLITTGCGTGSDDPAPAAAPAPTRTTAGSSTVPASSAVALVDGEDYDVVATLPAILEGESAYWFGVDAEGGAYGEVIVPDPEADPGSMGAVGSYAQPVLLSPTGDVTHMAPVRDSGVTMQLTGASADERWVTWLESESAQIGSGLWSLYSYERATKRLRKLGSYQDPVVGDDSVLDYDGRPEIIGHDVVMGTQSQRDKGKGYVLEVLTAPLDGSKPLTTVVDGATSPDTDATGFSYQKRSGELMYRDLTGHTSAVAGKTDECHHYRSKVLLTCLKTSDGIEIRVDGPAGSTTFGPFSNRVGYTDLKDGWATFVSDPDGHPQTYAIDTATATLYAVSSSQNDWNLMGNGYASVARRNAKGIATSYQMIKLR